MCVCVCVCARARAGGILDSAFCGGAGLCSCLFVYCIRMKILYVWHRLHQYPPLMHVHAHTQSIALKEEVGDTAETQIINERVLALQRMLYHTVCVCVPMCVPLFHTVCVCACASLVLRSLLLVLVMTLSCLLCLGLGFSLGFRV